MHQSVSAMWSLLHKAIPDIDVGDADRLGWSYTVAERLLDCMLRAIELSSTVVDSAVDSFQQELWHM